MGGDDVSQLHLSLPALNMNVAFASVLEVFSEALVRNMLVVKVILAKFGFPDYYASFIDAFFLSFHCTSVDC